MNYELHLADEDTGESCEWLDFDYSYYDMVSGTKKGSFVRAIGSRVVAMIHKDLRYRHEAGMLPPAEYCAPVDPNQMTIDELLGGASKENT